jgi:ABC-2 type transport system ATP-binding protein
VKVCCSLQKQVSCPSCKTILLCTGTAGETVKVTCPSCGLVGKVTFNESSDASVKVVEIRNLTKSFGAFTAVDALDLTIFKGEIYGLLGPNGSGKTTIIKMLCSLLRPTAGSAKIFGHLLPCKSIMNQIGYMPQDTAIYLDNTVHENLFFFGGIYGMTKNQLEKKEHEMLAFVNLQDWRDSLVSTLSGGMKHRLSLACALIHEPLLVFLDEPTVGVDPELRATFWGYFESLAQKGTTVIITTHYMDEADHCSRVGFLRQGRLIADGRPDELKKHTGTRSLEEAFLFLTRGKKP